MKRDIEMVRTILLDYEQRQENAFEESLATMDAALITGADTDEGRENQFKAEHIRWMIDDGLLTKIGGDSAFFVRVTAKGCDYLDAIRDEGIWAKTKKAAADTGGNVTLELIKTLGIGFAKQQIKKHTDIDI